MATQPLLLPIARTERLNRQPKHRFQVQTLPMSITPFMIAPVMPGDTMRNLWFESRAVSDPIKNRLIGWKKEYLFFYVKITDLLVEAMKQMFIDPENTDIAATLGNVANSQAFYSAKGAVPYLSTAYQKIVEHYFRDEGEAWNNHVDGTYGYAKAQLKDIGWMDNLTDKDDMPMGDDIEDATTMQDLERLMSLYEQLRAMNIANMTYEDWLRQQGIAIPGKDEDRPELLAHFSDFAYPSNTIDPTDGSATSALSWVFKNSQRDPKFFKEPGFIVGLTVTRPKMYHSGLAGSAAEFLTRAWDWAPNYLRAMPETTLKRFDGDTGPLGDRTTAPDAYWFDMQDVFIHGDQFHNVLPFNVVPADTGDYNMVALPTGDTFNAKYPTQTGLDALFVSASPLNKIREDGYVSLTILGDKRDNTQTTLALA